MTQEYEANLGVAVFGDRGPEMHLEATKRRFFPLDPRPEDIDIRDIAHALARQCRYNGHINGEHYSVAEHCMLVASILCRDGEGKEMQRIGLLHDATECYTGDLTRPMKLAMRQLSGGTTVHDRISDRIEEVVFAKFGIPLPLPPQIKKADVMAAAIEKKFLLANGAAIFPGLPDVPPGWKRPACLPPAVAELHFLQAWEWVNK